MLTVPLASSTLVLVLGLAPKSTEIKAFSPDPAGSISWSSGPSLVERCNGARVASNLAPSREKCRRWKVEWRLDGKVWGITSGSKYKDVVKQRDAILGFAQRSARFFDRPIDPRFAAPSPPICEGCQQKDAGEVSGLWGEGQRFGGLEAHRARTDAIARLHAFEADLASEHIPTLPEVARLSKDPKLSRTAAKYAKTLDAAVRDSVRVGFDLDNAALLRSPKPALAAIKILDAREKTLDAELSALSKAVAKEVTRTHGGRYSEDNSTGTEVSQLIFEVDGTKVTVSHQRGTSRSVWFEGEVRLDGRVAGKSLVAPEGKKLKCNDHSTECGFVHVPAVVRFTRRKLDNKKSKEVLELWFQQSTWVPAKTFSR